MRRVALSIAALAYSMASAQTVWQEVGSFSAGPIHVIIADNHGRIFLGTDIGGVYFSSNNGGIWTRVNSGLTVPYVRSLAADSTGNVFVGTQGGGVFRSTDCGASWMATPLPSQWTIRALAANGRTILLAGTSGGGVFRSSDGGVSWMQLNSGMADPFVRSFSFSSPDTLFAGTGFAGVYRSTDAGSTWAISFSNDGDIRSLAGARAQLAYAGAAGSGVFRTTNAGNTWHAINTGLTNLVLEALSVTSSGDVWAATRGGVFCSTNSGATWLPRNSGLSDVDVRSLVVVPNGFLFVGTASGRVFRSTLVATVVGPSAIAPTQPTLEQNYPNPFNSKTIIRYHMVPGKRQFATLRVFDMLGREVATLVRGEQEGSKQIEFNADALASGIFFYRIQGSDFMLSRKMTLMK
jgi:photosystem II stability/assembly factor-like uncharacterized protein